MISRSYDAWGGGAKYDTSLTPLAPSITTSKLFGISHIEVGGLFTHIPVLYYFIVLFFCHK